MQQLWSVVSQVNKPTSAAVSLGSEAVYLQDSLSDLIPFMVKNAMQICKYRLGPALRSNAFPLHFDLELGWCKGSLGDLLG